MKYLIIIPIYTDNKCESELLPIIKECIQSVVNNTDKYETQIILVVNGYTTETRRMIEDFEYKYQNIYANFYPNGLGFAGAINEGLKYAHGDYIVLLNDDCVILDANWLDLLTIPFNNPKIAITGVHSNWSEILNEKFIIGYCFCFKRQLVSEIGNFDTNLGIGGYEDCDFCHRTKLAGYDICAVGEPNGQEKDLMIGSFPIYHAAEKTMDYFDSNKLRLIATERLKNKWASTH